MRTLISFALSHKDHKSEKLLKDSVKNPCPYLKATL